MLWQWKHSALLVSILARPHRPSITLITDINSMHHNCLLWQSQFITMSRHDDVMSRHVTSWRRDNVPSRQVTWYQMAPYVMTKWIYIDQSIRSSENHVFQLGDLDLWPMNLTFKPSRDIIKVTDRRTPDVLLATKSEVFIGYQIVGLFFFCFDDRGVVGY